MRAVWIDADEAVRRYAHNYLPTQGCHVLTAATGETGLELLQSGRPLDAAILDHQLPDMLGTEVLRRLRWSGSHLPIMYLSSCGNAAIAHEVGSLLWTSYKEKPLVEQPLVSALKELVMMCRLPLLPPLFSFRRPGQLQCVVAAQAALKALEVDPNLSQLLPRILLSVLADREASYFEFRAAARCLKALQPSQRMLNHVRFGARVFEEAVLRDARSTPALERLVALLQGAGPKLSCLRGEVLATEMGLQLAEFNRWLVMEFDELLEGIKRLIRVRQAVLRLAETNDPVKLIALSIGYRHPRDMDRDFERTLKNAPRSVRTLLAPA